MPGVNENDPRHSGVSAEIPDWSREIPHHLWEPGKRLLQAIREYQRLAKKRDPISRARQKYLVAQHLFWSTVCSCDIPLNCQLGGGIALRHPLAVVIHPETVVGPNCMIFQGVTLGMGGKLPGAPVIGGHVDIGAGAKILGGVIIGDHAQIGANAVVLDHVPAGATAVGVPARVLPASRH